MPINTAYGFVSLKDVWGDRVNQVGVTRLREAIEASTSAWNDEINMLLSNWAQRSETIKERVDLPGSGESQPIDERGNPLPVAPSGSYDAGYPIQGGGTAWGTDRVTSQLITIEEANRYTLDAFQRDASWVRRRLFAALFTNTSYTFNDKFLGDVTVRPLANGDVALYLRTGAVDATTDTHYLAQADPISDAANPFPTIHAELMEHPSNSGPYVVYVPSNLTDSIEALEVFTPVGDPDVVLSQTKDRLGVNPTEQILGPGSEILGKASKCWVVEWRALPDNYMVGVALGAGPFMRMREYPSQNLQGLFSEFHSSDGNLIENRFIRYAGFGVKNRVAALVYQIGSGSYSIPTGYSAPLP